MDSIDLNAIYESYMQIYEDVEDLEEELTGPRLKRAEEKISQLNRDNKTEAAQNIRNVASNVQGTSQPTVRGGRFDFKTPTKRGGSGKKGKPKVIGYDIQLDRPKKMKESYDHYDIVLEYLLDEGLCESVENAEIMMAHMSETWIEGIIEAKEDEGLSSTEKRQKRNERLGMKTKERQSEHRGSRNERGNYGVDGNRYEATKTSKGNYPSIRRRGRGFTDPGYRD
jgi:hypothetical protein